MPNGKPGDIPYTDIVSHGRRVYSEEIDRLVRDMLSRQYDGFSKPDVEAVTRPVGTSRAAPPRG